MNSNSWTNKFNGFPIGRDRNNEDGFTLGGPLFIPKKLNTNKDKLLLRQRGGMEEPEPQQREPDHADRRGEDRRLLTLAN